MKHSLHAAEDACYQVDAGLFSCKSASHALSYSGSCFDNEGVDMPAKHSSKGFTLQVIVRNLIACKVRYLGHLLCLTRLRPAVVSCHKKASAVILRDLKFT